MSEHECEEDCELCSKDAWLAAQETDTIPLQLAIQRCNAFLHYKKLQLERSPDKDEQLFDEQLFHDELRLIVDALASRDAHLEEIIKALEFYADGKNYIRLTVAEEGGGMGVVKYSLVALKNFTEVPQEKAREALVRVRGEL